MVKLGDVNPVVWDEVTEKMEAALKDIEFNATEDLLLDWRFHAAKRKLDRELFEQYGVYKDIILHPTFQYVKQLVEENVDFNIQLGDPIMPLATTIIVLFMMYKRVNNTALWITAAFLFNINPFYVALGAIAWWWFFENKKPKQYMKAKRTKKSGQSSSTIEASLFSSLQSDTSDYDHVLIGNDIGTLYTAALLSKVGHRCCVLQPPNPYPLEIKPFESPCQIPIQNLAIGKVERYQALLDVVSCDTATGSRLTFAPVGTPESGFMSSVIRSVETGKGGGARGGKSVAVGASEAQLQYLRPGTGSVARDIASIVAEDRAPLEAYLATIADAQQSLTGYLIGRIVPSSQAAALFKADTAKKMVELAGMSTNQILRQAPHAQSAYGALAAVAFTEADDSLLATESSAVFLAQSISCAEQAIFYPIGGPAAVESSLIDTIQRAGGNVYKDVPIAAIKIETVGGVRRATGVRYCQPSSAFSAPERAEKQEEVKSGDQTDGEDDEDDDVIYASKSVVSGAGVLCTYLHLLPHADVSAAARTMLAPLTEARPRVRVLYWLRGNVESLKLSSSDYFELPKQSLDDETPTHQMREKLAESSLRVWSPSAKDPSWAKRFEEIQTVVVEFDAVEPLVRLEVAKFETEPLLIAGATAAGATGSAFDGHAAGSLGGGGGGPRLYGDGTSHSKRSTGTSNAAGREVDMNDKTKSSYKVKADVKLREVYPSTEGKILHTHVLPPVVGGQAVSATPAKYASAISATTDITGLFLTGRDLGTSGLAGDIQGGWVAANAVLGYSVSELQAGRNIVADLANMN